MAKRSAASEARARGVITTAADATRLELVYRLTPEVLLHEDPRVQAAYHAFEQRVTTTDARLYDAQSLIEITALVTLVRDLGLSHYRWLPGALFWQFCRGVTPDLITAELPKDVVATLPAGQAPKDGETHREDLERYIRWWYRREVKRPPDAIRELAREWVAARRDFGRTSGDGGKDVRSGIRRIKEFFGCLRV